MIDGRERAALATCAIIKGAEMGWTSRNDSTGKSDVEKLEVHARGQSWGGFRQGGCSCVLPACCWSWCVGD